MKGSASRVRANFLAVVAAQSRSALLANRLDMALNNMSHGLMMVDANGRRTVANRQILRSVPAWARRRVGPARSLRAVVRKLSRANRRAARKSSASGSR